MALEADGLAPENFLGEFALEFRGGEGVMLVAFPEPGGSELTQSEAAAACTHVQKNARILLDAVALLYGHVPGERPARGELIVPLFENDSEEDN